MACNLSSSVIWGSSAFLENQKNQLKENAAVQFYPIWHYFVYNSLSYIIIPNNNRK